MGGPEGNTERWIVVFPTQHSKSRANSCVNQRVLTAWWMPESSKSRQMRTRMPPRVQKRTEQSCLYLAGTSHYYQSCRPEMTWYCCSRREKVQRPPWTPRALEGIIAQPTSRYILASQRERSGYNPAFLLVHSLAGCRIWEGIAGTAVVVGLDMVVEVWKRVSSAWSGVSFVFCLRRCEGDVRSILLLRSGTIVILPKILLALLVIAICSTSVRGLIVCHSYLIRLIHSILEVSMEGVKVSRGKSL